MLIIKTKTLVLYCKIIDIYSYSVSNPQHKSKNKRQKQTNRRMPHPWTMLQQEKWALRMFHPCYQMIKPESQESLACPVTDDESNTKIWTFYFYEWYGRWSDPSEPRSETHWVMFNLSSFRVWLRDDVQRSHVILHSDHAVKHRMKCDKAKFTDISP